MSADIVLKCQNCGEPVNQLGRWMCRGQHSFAAPAGSAASLKAEIGALKEKRSDRWWHDSPNNRDLQEVLILMDKLADVTEKLERQMPPNEKVSDDAH